MSAVTRAAHVRRTSQYSLTVPAPEHADADRQAALDALVAATTASDLIVTGAWVRSEAGTISVSYRATDDDTAAALAHGILAEYGAAEPADAGMHTGYGIGRRDFRLDA